jgi:hypothetical protein
MKPRSGAPHRPPAEHVLRTVPSPPTHAPSSKSVQIRSDDVLRMRALPLPVPG